MLGFVAGKCVFNVFKSRGMFVGTLAKEAVSGGYAGFGEVSIALQQIEEAVFYGAGDWLSSLGPTGDKDLTDDVHMPQLRPPPTQNPVRQLVSRIAWVLASSSRASLLQWYGETGGTG